MFRSSISEEYGYSDLVIENRKTYLRRSNRLFTNLSPQPPDHSDFDGYIRVQLPDDEIRSCPSSKESAYVLRQGYARLTTLRRRHSPLDGLFSYHKLFSRMNEIWGFMGVDKPREDFSTLWTRHSLKTDERTQTLRRMTRLRTLSSRSLKILCCRVIDH